MNWNRVTVDTSREGAANNIHGLAFGVSAQVNEIWRFQPFTNQKEVLQPMEPNQFSI